MQAVQIDMDRSPSLWTHFKRQRKTPPASVTSESNYLLTMNQPVQLCDYMLLFFKAHSMNLLQLMRATLVTKY